MANLEAESLNRSTLIVMNGTTTCQYSNLINPYSFMNQHLLKYTTPVVLLQTIVIFLCARTLYFLLQPLYQTTFISQLVTGIIIGPSFLGKIAFFDELFGFRKRYVLRTWAEFGLLLHWFVLGVQVDLGLVKHMRKRAIIIGLSGSILPLIFGMTTLQIIQQTTHLDADSEDGILPSVFVNSLSSFISITGFLKELKMLSSDLGRLASSASMVSDLFGFVMNSSLVVIIQARKDSTLKPLYIIPVVISYYSIMLFLLRPLIIWIVSQTSDGESMKQTHIIAVLCIVLGTCFVGGCLGNNAAFCAFIFGLSLPDGPPLGSQLAQKLDFITYAFQIPIFSAISGLKMELYLLRDRSTAKIAIPVVMAYIGKLTGVILSSLWFGLSFLKALCLALILCSRGVVELSIYNLWKDRKTITAQIFAILIINMVIVTGIASIIVGYLYDPSRRYRLDVRRAIYKSKQTSLRMLICVQNEEHVNSLMSLLEVSNPSRNSPITAFVLQLTELRGSVSAFLKPCHRKKNSEIPSSPDIVNFLNQLQHSYHGNVVVQYFTSVVPYESMHDDICTLALDKRVAIIILPFHKQWCISGMVETSNLSIRALNKNVIDKAPCTVGILVCRGQMISNQSVLTRKSFNHVVMLFIGGTDDREALAYSKRMAGHQNISLTLVWLKSNDVNLSSEDFVDLDNQMMVEIMQHSTVGKNITFKEEFVKDGVGTTQVIQKLLENNFIDLFIVGKNHDRYSKATLGLTEWIEYPELGIIGDTLLNSNDKFSVLVVQQQKEGN